MVIVASASLPSIVSVPPVGVKLFAVAPSKSPATVIFPLDIASVVVEDSSNSPLTSKVAPEPEIVKSPSISAFPVHSISPSEIVIEPPLL